MGHWGLTLPCVRTMRPTDPPGTYSRKIDRCSIVSSMPTSRASVGVSTEGRLVLTKVLDNLGVLEILEQLNLGLEGRDHALLAEVFLVAPCLGQLDLLDGDELGSGDVVGEVDATVRPTTDELSLDPLERDCRRNRQYRR